MYVSEMVSLNFPSRSLYRFLVSPVYYKIMGLGFLYILWFYHEELKFL